MKVETGSEAARSKDGGAGEQLTSGGGEKRDPATGFLSRGRPLKKTGMHGAHISQTKQKQQQQGRSPQICTVYQGVTF